MAIFQLGEYRPTVDATAFVHEQATLIGRVVVGAHATVWPQATLRAEAEPIVVGASSSVQDGAVLHTDPGFPVSIGTMVTIGHMVMLHGCTIGDGALIGIQSVILNGAVIGRECLVAAGSLVTEGKTFPDRTLIMGRPAKVARELTESDLASLRASAEFYVTRGAIYRREQRRIG